MKRPTSGEISLGEISIIQVSLLFVTGIGLKDHVTIIPPLIQTAGKDGWLSILLTFFLISAWGLLLIYIYNGIGRENLFSWLGQNIGKWPTLILKFIVSLYLVSLASATAKEMIAWTNVTYLITTPAILLIIIFIAICVFMASTNLQSLAIVNVFLLTLIIILGLFIGVSNMRFKDFSLLRPVLEHGIEPVFSGTLYTLSGSIELIVILFLSHKIHGMVHYKVIVINAFLLAFLTMGPFIGAITEFGVEEASKQNFPAFAEWSILSLGRFIEHMDFFSIYQWLSGAFIRVSFLLYISAEVCQIKKNSKKTFLLLFYGLLIIAFVLWPMSDADYYALSKKILLPLTLWFFLFLSLVLGCIVFVVTSRKRGSSNVPKKTSQKTAKSKKTL